MDLSSELISQFAKITNDNKKEKTESTVYGTTVILDGRTYVKLDGSDRLTPVETTTAVAEDERVMITIKDHTATITGNISSPAAKDNEVKKLGNKIDEFDTIVADKVKAETAEIETAIITKLDGKYATFESLDATYASIKSLEAAEADIDDLQADNVEINDKLTARAAEIDQLKANSLTVEVADAKYATIDELEATTGEFNSLKSTYGDFVDLTTDKFEAIEADIAELDVESLNAKYASIDFSNIGEAAIEKLFTDSGIIGDLVMSDGKVTGKLVGVTIIGDLIEGNTVKADKLVIQGEDGLYYKLNVNSLGEATASSDEKYQNGLDGSVIVANSITAQKISVEDLVAFGATIGGFHIDDHALYSGVKSSIDNTTPGIHMGDDGQVNLGDSNNFLKFYKDQNGSYKLDISASSLRFGATGQSVEEVITDIQSTNSSSGSSIVLTDSSDGNLIDLKIYGKTTQNGTPTPDAPVPLISVGDSGSFELGVYGKNLLENLATTTTRNGLTLTVNEGGSMTINGTATITTMFNINTNLKLDGTYILSGCPSEVSQQGVEWLFYDGAWQRDTGSGKTFTTSKVKAQKCVINIPSGKTITNATIYPMIRLATETDSTYEPCNKQTLTMPYELRSIPNTSIKDVKDFAIGKKIQKIHQLTFDGSEGWEALSNGRVMRYVESQYAPNVVSDADLYNAANAVCNIAPVSSWANLPSATNGVAFGNLNNIAFKVTGHTESIEAWKSYLASNPVTVVYALKIPIETELTEEELEAYAALHTNNPNTTIFADGSPELYVEYFKNTRDGQALANNTASIQISSDRISSKVTDNAQSITGVKTDIEQLSDQISNLVQDGSGKSLMTQTPTGWTFSMGDYEATLNNLLSHVKIGTYNGQPCLELTVDDSKQRLMLTNTDIRFMESDTTAAYITGDAMNIDNARIDNKFSIDGYEWSLDSDDTLNLLYT